MKTKSAILTSISVLMCGLFIASACSNQVKYTWNLKDIGENVNFHTATQTAYLADSKSIKTDGKQELSRPEPIHFTWSATPEKESDITVDQYVVEISDSLSFKDSVTYTTAGTELDVYNLCIATEYYWRVTAKLSNGKESVSTHSAFTTADVAPRNLYVDGITNVRDLGGWKTTDGGRVKQGMIYRCGRLNVSEQPEVEIEITDDGIKTMRDILGVKSEIDLRNPASHNTETGGITSSPLGEGVEYKNFAMEWEVPGGTNILTYQPNVPEIKKVFEYLAKPESYPVIYHCNIGTDRTGLFAFLINGLLGVAEDDLYKDYLFSNLGKINNVRDVSGIQTGYVKTLKDYKGGNLSLKIENYLAEVVGVSRDDINSLRDLLKED